MEKLFHKVMSFLEFRSFLLTRRWGRTTNEFLLEVKRTLEIFAQRCSCLSLWNELFLLDQLALDQKNPFI
jgi:hypothetical protein